MINEHLTVCVDGETLESGEGRENSQGTFIHNKLHLLPAADPKLLGSRWETTSVEAFVGFLYLWKEKPPGDLGTRLPN